MNCPYCGIEISSAIARRVGVAQPEETAAQVAAGPFSGEITSIVLIACPGCRKVLGAARVEQG